MTMKKKRRFRAKVLSAMLIVSLLAGTAGTSAFASADDPAAANPAAVSQLEETDGAQDPLPVLKGSEDGEEEAAAGETDVTETGDTSAAPEETGENEEDPPVGTEETAGEPKEDGAPVTSEETGENNSEPGTAAEETSGEPEEDKAADGTEETGEPGGKTAAAVEETQDEIKDDAISAADGTAAAESAGAEEENADAAAQSAPVPQSSRMAADRSVARSGSTQHSAYLYLGVLTVDKDNKQVSYQQWPTRTEFTCENTNGHSINATHGFKWTDIAAKAPGAIGYVNDPPSVTGKKFNVLPLPGSGELQTSNGRTLCLVYRVYTIKYVDAYDDGEIITEYATYTQKEGETTKKPADPTKTGFTFKGWSPSVAPTVTEDVTYKAVWEKNAPKKVRLIYNDNTGTSSEPYAYYEGDNVRVKSLSDVNFEEREGYTFLGWNTDASASIADWAADDRFIINNDMTLYAVWEKKQDTGDDTKKPQLQLTKTVDKSEVKAGEKVVYTITVENKGPGTVTDLIVEDGAVEGLTFGDATLDGKPIKADQYGKYSIGDLSEGASVTLKISATVDWGMEAGSVICNTATAEYTNPDGEKPTDTAESKLIEETEPKTYPLTIHYLWNGADEQYKKAADDHTETLEDGADFKVDSPEQKVPFAYTVAPETVKGIAGGNQQMVWNVIYTPKVQINHIYRVNGEVKGNYLEPAEKELPFNGTLTADGIQKRTDYDGETYAYTEADTLRLPSNPADLTEQPVLNLYYDRTTDAAAAPALKITKEADREEVEAGKTVNYTVTVENTGKAAATDVKVTDILPAELTLVSATVALDKDGYALGDIPAGETRTFRITAAVKEEVPAGTQIINVVTAEYSNRPENTPVPRDEAKVTVVEEPEKPTTPDPTPGETTDPDPDPDPTPGRTTDPDPDPDPTPGETTDPDPTPEPGGGDTPTSGPVLTPVVIRTAVPTTTTTVPVPAAETPAPTETAEVTDGEVPAAEEAGAEAAEDEELLLADEGVPLATGAGRSWALINFALMNLAIFESLMLLIGYFVRTKNSADEEDEEKKKKLKKKGIMRVISLPVAVISLIAFCLTEDISLPTALVDRYTLLMAIIALIQTVVVFLSRKEVKDEDEEEAEAEA